MGAPQSARWSRPLLVAALAATLSFTPSLAASLGPQVDEPLRNSVPLPSQRAAEAQFAAGDRAFATYRANGREGALRLAFDAWQAGIGVSSPGDGIRLALPEVPPDLFPDPRATFARRAEGPYEAAIRRLASLTPDLRSRWTERFSPSADTALARALELTTGIEAACADVERSYPLTAAAARAALICADLHIERGQPSSAATWLERAARHIALNSPKLQALEAALENRRAALTRARSRRTGFDHATPPPTGAVDPTAPRATGAPTYTGLSLESSHRIVGLMRSAVDPLGRGLGSGIAVLANGMTLAQSSLGFLLLAEAPAQPLRLRSEDALGTGRAPMRATARSGGWASLPATDGYSWAVVVGRAERPRAFLDVAVAPIGNTLGVLAPGPADRPLTPRWTLRDGLMVPSPGQPGEKAVDPLRAAPLGGGQPVEGWNFGRGWEFQPGPVFADGAIYCLMRGLGDPTDENATHTDEIRLIAVEADGTAVRWSRSITKERGTPEEIGRGQASLFAATTMPLALDRASGTLLVGTNVGLLCGYGAADGRLLWALRTQRSEAGDPGWTGSTAPLFAAGQVDHTEGGHPAGWHRSVWFTPHGSSYAYCLPAGPTAADGSLLREPPRPRGTAEILIGTSPQSTAPQPRAPQSTATDLVLLGRDGRYDAVLLDQTDPERPGSGPKRIPASYLGPLDRLSGTAAWGRGVLFVPGTAEISVVDPARGWTLIDAAALPSRGAGRGGNLALVGQRLYVAGRDTVWVYRLD